MADKKYYWIKLKDTLITSDAVGFLMKQEYGANYVVLYQMLCLKTINTEGRLERKIGEITIPFDEEKIQKDCKYFDIETIKKALELYKKLDLIYKDIDGTLTIRNHKEMVGSETSKAKLMRNLREKNDDNGNNVTNELPKCYQNVTNDEVTMLHRERDKRIEKENRERDKRIEKEKEIKNSSFDFINEIITYLNSICNTNFKPNTPKTQTLIQARLNDGFSIDDFKTVIDKKSSEWLDTEWQKYLRPETLFGNKFESYLNQVAKKSSNEILEELFKEMNNNDPTRSN